MLRHCSRQEQLHGSEKMPRKQLHSFRSLAHCKPHQAVDDRVEGSGWGLANSLTQRRFFTFRRGAGFDAVQKQCANSVLVELHGDNSEDGGQTSVIKNEINSRSSYPNRLYTLNNRCPHCPHGIHLYKTMLLKIKAIYCHIIEVYLYLLWKNIHSYSVWVIAMQHFKNLAHVCSIKSHGISPHSYEVANG